MILRKEYILVNQNLVYQPNDLIKWFWFIIWNVLWENLKSNSNAGKRASVSPDAMLVGPRRQPNDPILSARPFLKKYSSTTSLAPIHLPAASKAQHSATGPVRRSAQLPLSHDAWLPTCPVVWLLPPRHVTQSSSLARHLQVLPRRCLWWTPHVDEPPFSQATRRCCAESACCKHMFQLFFMFQKYAASVLYGCCKSRSGCCICCSGSTRMLSASFPIVSSVFWRMLQVFYLDVAYVSHVCCKVLSGCCICCNDFQEFLGVFASVSNICRKCFSCFERMLQVLHLDVAKVDWCCTSCNVTYLP
jgi:hypothetical protein